MSGYTPCRATGWNVAVRAGIWFAVSPTWSLQLAADVAAHHLGNATTDVFATFGVSRLVH